MRLLFTSLCISWLASHAMAENFHNPEQIFINRTERRLQQSTHLYRLYMHPLISHSSIDQNGRTLLMLASREGLPKLVNFFISTGANSELETRDRSDATAIFIAANEDDTKCVQILHKAGANPNIHVRSLNGKTPLIMATINGNITIIKTLIGINGEKTIAVNINDADEEGRTALHYAAMYHTEFQEEGSSPNNIPPSLKFQNWTKENEVIKLLLENGAKNLPDNHDFTPLNWAIGRENEIGSDLIYSFSHTPDHKR